MNQLLKRLRLAAAVLAAVLTFGTVGFWQVEGMALYDSLYFSVVTVATVGYGDLHPVTPAGKLLAIVLIITGVGTFLGVVANGTELLLARRQEGVRREKMNMVVGLFFAEIGTELLRIFAATDPQARELGGALDIDGRWDSRRFSKSVTALGGFALTVDPSELDLEKLRSFFKIKSELLLRLLENPNLAEHDEFTNMMRAVFHLKAELFSRDDLTGLPDSDVSHIGGDADRAYGPLTKAWLEHMRYLKDNYPYLYSLAVRTNPFHGETSAVVT